MLGAKWGCVNPNLAMNVTRPDFYARLVRELAKNESELGWVEFKVNFSEPKVIGQYISALSNSTALLGQDSAYFLWGVEDESHEIVGTTFKVGKVEGQDLEYWLKRQLKPAVDFRFHEVEVDDKRIIVLEIPAATSSPVSFQGVEFIRIGSHKRVLHDFPETEKGLWKVFDRTPFEQVLSKKDLEGTTVLEMLDYSIFFKLLDHEIPDGRARILEQLQDYGLVQLTGAESWNITNLGAITLGENLEDFALLSRKALRVIEYSGTSRVDGVQEREFTAGYAKSIESAMEYILARIPKNEVIAQTLRKEVTVYPEVAIRELLANALIHQDFSIGGAGPVVEIFSNRIEITNPGVPLIEPNRFLDKAARSRNPTLARLMRRLKFCEERGSGIDRVVFLIEFHQLPAPWFEADDASTRAVLFAPAKGGELDSEARVRACYLHACLRYVNREYLTNESVRERFGIAKANSATASRFIKEATEAGMILPDDANAAKKLMRYVPYWAKRKQTVTSHKEEQ
jgi:ATP-dependent DNA helicase RecG